MTSLCDLGLKYGTDKSPLFGGGDGHYYTPWYSKEFNEHRKDVRKVFELGISNGASILMWHDYFMNADIYCADIHQPGIELMKNRLGIHAYYVDQSNAQSLVELRDQLPKGFDLMIDDGSHDPEDQILTANILADRLAPGGYYVIEDVQPPTMNWLKVYDGILWPWETTIWELGPKPDDRLIVIERPNV
jgi:hypothetical protein